MARWPHQNDVDSFYGDPRGRNGEGSSKWESENIVRVPAPWKLMTSWDFRPVSAVRVHKNCAESLRLIFDRIWDAANQDQNRINEWGMHLFAGGFQFRRMTGAPRLSMHSWGCAVDFDNARNSYGDTTPNFALIPPVLEAFASEEWVWGGNWKKPDGMHWQAAIV